MPNQLQELFVILLIFEGVIDTYQLWTKNFDAMAEDFVYRNIPNGPLRVQAGIVPNLLFVISAQNEQDHISLLLDAIYPNLATNSTNTDFITERAILTSLNSTVNEINKQIVEKFPREQYTYFSFDSVPKDTLNLYPIEFLNTLTPQGLSPHTLALKINVSIMLLRNLDPVNGLCNGTRLICHGLQMYTIDAKIVTGSYQGKHVFIPRIPLLALEDLGLPFILEKKQFSICLAFALMINKSQGQTLPYIGLYLS
ncbi:30334_t:CDS:2 [Gigaspora margarita]|uniref:30334_t:CDS:1 n=1 Tax=Gigaspora margarita TaxID=4874 RepID=A0ABN7VNE3_GIGMA|nr:30334_t:CDS:2 [Gigaspora margarita]